MKHSDVVGLNSRAVYSREAQKVNETLTEYEILSLQDAFLINGFHSIQVSNQVAGRFLVLHFLRSIPIYTHNACLTLSDNPRLPADILDIHNSLYTEAFSEQSIEEFFINNSYFDFMWIEMSPNLTKAFWFEYFCKILEAYSQQMPIIKVYSGKTLHVQ